MDIEFYTTAVKMQPLTTGKRPDFEMMKAQLLLRQQRALVLQLLISGIIAGLLLVVR